MFLLLDLIHASSEKPINEYPVRPSRSETEWLHSQEARLPGIIKVEDKNYGLKVFGFTLSASKSGSVTVNIQYQCAGCM